MSLDNISKEASKSWNSESIEVRHYFVALAGMCKKRHAERFPDYRYSPKRVPERSESDIGKNLNF
jgi:hypothetical protein